MTRSTNAPGAPRSARMSRLTAHLFTYAFLIGVAALMIGPFVFSVLTSIKTPKQFNTTTPLTLPDPATTENYLSLFGEKYNFVVPIVVTAQVVLVLVAGQMTSSVLAAYAFAQLNFRGRDAIFWVYIATLMIPAVVTIIPLYSMMTAWGLKNTSFTNVTGLTEPGHQSTARDMAIIASHIIRDFPEYFPYYSIREYKYNNISQANRNLLLRRDPSVDGMKTGHTEAAGYCLLATAQREFPNLGSAGAPGKRRLIAVVMHTTSSQARANEAQKLLNWGYQAFDTVRLFDDAKPIATPPIWKGKVDQVKLGASGSVFISVPKGEGGKLETKVERTDPLVAPLTKGQQVGTIKVETKGGGDARSVPLVVLETVDEAGLLGRAWDSLRLWIK